jgi:hypothetical protein
MIALHAYVGDTVVAHTMGVGAAGARSSLADRAPEFVAWARSEQATRHSSFGPAQPA